MWQEYAAAPCSALTSRLRQPTRGYIVIEPSCDSRKNVSKALQGAYLAALLHPVSDG